MISGDSKKHAPFQERRLALVVALMLSFFALFALACYSRDYIPFDCPPQVEKSNRRLLQTMEQHYVACGRSDRCNPASELVADSEVRAVRCVSDSAKSGWTQCNGRQNLLWGDSDIW